MEPPPIIMVDTFVPFQALQALPDAVRRADQVAGVDQLGGHRCHCLVAPAGEVQVLDPGGGVLETHGLGVVVVEVSVACPHAADVERHVAPDGAHAFFDAVAHDHGHEGRDIEVGG